MKLTIRQHRNNKGLTLEQLAERAGISRSYLTELELGAKTINANRLEQIAKAMNLRVIDLFELQAAPVRVMCKVGRDGHLIEGEAKRSPVHCPPQLSPVGLCAAEVQEGAFAPIWQDGDLLFYYEPAARPPMSAMNRPAVIHPASSPPLVGVLRMGSESGLFHIEQLWPRATVEYDAAIRCAARVELVLPAELVGTPSET